MKKSRAGKMEGKKILVGVTGCIAAYKACELVSRLTQAGAEVRVIMTRAAGEFITPLTFTTLSRQQVFTAMFPAPREFDPVHVNLAAWADLMVIAPATANIIGKIACGIADDLLSCTVMATRAPVLIAPAMHTAMWENRIVRDNVKKLKSRGYHFAGPDTGYLACGCEGVGRLTAPEEMLHVIEGLIRRHAV